MSDFPVWLTAGVMAVLGVLYQLGKHRGAFSRRLYVMMKGGATACAAGLALYAYLKNGGGYAMYVSTALAVSALADMVLDKHFEAGMAVFAAAHLLYLAAFAQKGAALAAPLLYFALAAFQAGLSVCLSRRKKKPMYHVGLYGCLLLLMAMTAWPLGGLARAGALFFLVSDGFIGWSLMFKPSVPNDIGCIALYYIGQFCLALSAV